MFSYTKKNEVNWNNIFILSEFLAYFNYYDLKDFSLLTRIVRNRLKHKLFSKTSISGKHMFNKLNLNTIRDIEGANVLDYIDYWYNSYRYTKLKDKWEVQLSNNIGLFALRQLLKDELKGIIKFITSFSISEYSFSFYFLSPIVFDLTNLTLLNLCNCSFPLLMMLRIGEHLNSLRILKLDSVYVFGLVKQELTPEDAYFPQNLEELSIQTCKVYNMGSVPNTFSLVQHRWSHINDDLVNLRGLKIPNLKKLNLDFVHANQFVLKLLKLNPQVEELKISSYDMTQDVSNLISISSNLKNIIIYSNESFPYISEDLNLIIPKFTYIKNLNMKFGESYYESLIGHNQCIIKYFPNLTHLMLNVDSLEDFRLNNFLKANLLFNNTIDKLTLGPNNYDYYEENEHFEYSEFILDFSSLINIKCLILDTDGIPLYSIKFNNIPDKLKIIRVRFNPKSDHIKYIEGNPNIFRKWKVNLKDCYIYFTR
jgi:hypothetical protein